MNKLALDSGFVIDFLNDKERARRFLEESNAEKIVFPSIAKMEVIWGNENILKFDDLDVIGFDQRHVKEALEIKKYLDRKGERINRSDVLIASQAVLSNSTLVYGDKDFRKLKDYPGFRSESYR